jgi:hypothetical protein
VPAAFGFFSSSGLNISEFCILYKKKDVTLQSIMAKEKNNELEKRNQAFLIYQDENGIARVNVRFEGEDVWLTVEQMMELFDASQQDISYHINQILIYERVDAEKPFRSLRSIARWKCCNTRATMTGQSKN